MVDRIASSWCLVRRRRSLSWEMCRRRGVLLGVEGMFVVLERKGKRERRMGRLAVRRARADSR